MASNYRAVPQPVPNDMSRQAVINGNFDIWQRGTSFTNPATDAYMADRYRMQYTNITLPTTVTHSRITLTPGDVLGSFYGYRVTVDGAGSVSNSNALYMIGHNVENGVRFLSGAGNKITVSFYARSSIAGKKLGMSVANFYGSGGTVSGAEVDMPGTTFSLTSTWKRYTWTMNTLTTVGKNFGTNNDDFISLRFFYAWGTNIGAQLGGGAESFIGAGTIDITQVQICAGDIALPFQPRTPAEELEFCQRYYETSYDTNVAPGTATSVGSILTATNDNTATGSTYNTVEFKELKRVAPNVTIYGTGGTVNTVNDGTADRALDTGNLTEDIGQYGFNQNYTVTGAAGPARKFHFTADAEL